MCDMAHFCVALLYSNNTQSVLTAMSWVGSVKIPPVLTSWGIKRCLLLEVGYPPLLKVPCPGIK